MHDRKILSLNLSGIHFKVTTIDCFIGMPKLQYYVYAHCAVRAG